MTPEGIKRSPAAPTEIIHFWFIESGRRKWFMGGPLFDAEVSDRFSAHYNAAACNMLSHWQSTPSGALALILILDQFSRNMFRRNAQAFAKDAKARQIAHIAIEKRFDMVTPEEHRAFFYMPFMHSEDLADQRQSVALFKARLPTSSNVRYAIEHMQIIEEFGRFPHRNKTLGRRPTPAEDAYLAQGGFSA